MKRDDQTYRERLIQDWIDAFLIAGCFVGVIAVLGLIAYLAFYL